MSARLAAAFAHRRAAATRCRHPSSTYSLPACFFSSSAAPTPPPQPEPVFVASTREREREATVDSLAAVHVSPSPVASHAHTPSPSSSSPSSSSSSASSSSSFHSRPVFRDGQLARDFIAASLYHPELGYFNVTSRINATLHEAALPSSSSSSSSSSLSSSTSTSPSPQPSSQPQPQPERHNNVQLMPSTLSPLAPEPLVPIPRPSPPTPRSADALDFASIYARDEYYERLQRLYGQLNQSWMTPVELFQPFYAQAVARWLVQSIAEEAEERRRERKREREGEREAAAAGGGREEEADEGGSKHRVSFSNPHAHSAKPSTSFLGSLFSSSSAYAAAPPLPPLDADESLRILEVGGGNGTCAKGILDYLREFYPALYRRTHYSIVDLSTLHSKRQALTLHEHMPSSSSSSSASSSSSSSSSHLPRISLLNLNILDWSEHVSERVFVIGLELLDNMPHDKILVQGGSKGGHVFETRVRRAPNTQMKPYMEEFVRVTDPWIEECLTTYEDFVAAEDERDMDGEKRRIHALGNYTNRAVTRLHGLVQAARDYMAARAKMNYIYLPTTALHFFHLLFHFMPRHRLLLADFSFLPDTIVGINAPIVSGLDHTGKQRDFDNFCVPLGVADIFFPTNFEFMAALYKATRLRRAYRENARAQALLQQSRDSSLASSSPAVHAAPIQYEDREPVIESNYEFMMRFAIHASKRDWHARGLPAKQWRSPTKSRTNFDPLLMDYANFKFMTV